MGQVYLHIRIRGAATLDAIAQVHKVPDEVIEPIYDRVIGRRYLTEDAGGLRLTDTGRTEVDRIQASWRRWLDTRLDDWDCSDPADRALLDRALENIAAKLLDEETREQEVAHA